MPCCYASYIDLCKRDINICMCMLEIEIQQIRSKFLNCSKWTKRKTTKNKKQNNNLYRPMAKPTKWFYGNLYCKMPSQFLLAICTMHFDCSATAFLWSRATTKKAFTSTATFTTTKIFFSRSSHTYFWHKSR